jgi:serine/threonine protein kinase
MWAFGVILYTMLAGKPPFYHDDFEKLKKQVLACDVIFPKNMQSLSFLAKSFIYDLLHPDPAKRLTVQQALQHPWLNEPAEELEAVDLERNVAELRKYQTLKKLRAAVRGVVTINKMQKMVSARLSRASSVQMQSETDSKVESSVVINQNENHKSDVV